MLNEDGYLEEEKDKHINSILFAKRVKTMLIEINRFTGCHLRRCYGLGP